MICPKCHSKMSLVYHFDKEDSREFYLCNSCYFESRHIPVSFDRIFAKSEDKVKSEKRLSQSKDNTRNHKNKQKRKR